MRLIALALGVTVLGGAQAAAAPPRPETVATFAEAMPTGVTVSKAGRIFVNFPRWGDPVPFTVAEVVRGKAVPFPNQEINNPDEKDPARHFLSVQSVVVDGQDRLWALDTGSPQFRPTSPGGPKLVGIDLRTNKVFRTILFPPAVAQRSSYLNDVRFDLRRNRAYITDSAPAGPNGIVVVDLNTGESWRRLHNHPTTVAEPNFLPIVDGKPLMNRPSPGVATHMTVGSDGIAISPSGDRLYYTQLSGRSLYSVSTDALFDRRVSDAEVAATVRNLGVKGMGDGLESDTRGRVYGADIERNAVIRRLPDGRLQTIAQGPEISWADTLAISADRYLYFTANQLHRQAGFQEGVDKRVKPYLLLRLKIDAAPAHP
ncbi:major royal jelly family protein [Allokutzneria sp. A3M-2-11 16]|uniref:major royal jelly family protein n=1 Tax=Allokutzneria sp. A3M-2-11 16 TaxID=2962043 RepID=UPI0020B8439E|nr:major royal jelly family protein [Allokutzneria sp. A3M-2-11 16]MCP3799207.1 major royal jelly family protein [Allokutzneria sp. A3M-2-11 16]